MEKTSDPNYYDAAQMRRIADAAEGKVSLTPGECWTAIQGLELLIPTIKGSSSEVIAQSALKWLLALHTVQVERDHNEHNSAPRTKDPNYYNATQMKRIAASENLIEQYNKMSAHGGTDMFVIPKGDLKVILEALGCNVKFEES